MSNPVFTQTPSATDKAPLLVVVAWKTRPVEGAAALMPVFQAPSNYKDPEKISSYVQEQQSRWLSGCADLPYAGTFDAVKMVVVGAGVSCEFNYAGREPGSKKAAIAAASRNWLLRSFPGAWPDTIDPTGYRPRVLFLGFEPRRFFKMLGIECSLPHRDLPLPVSLWYGEAASRNYRDITEACIPREVQGQLSWLSVLAARGIGVKRDWEGPGGDVVEDVRLVSELAVQLGIIKKNEEQD